MLGLILNRKVLFLGIIAAAAFFGFQTGAGRSPELSDVPAAQAAASSLVNH